MGQKQRTLRFKHADRARGRQKQKERKIRMKDGP